MRARTPILLLLGSFAVGYNLAIILHELGHLLMSWITRGPGLQTWTVLFHPFSVSYVSQNDWSSLPPSTVWWILAGGVGVGTVVPLLLLPLAKGRPTGDGVRLAIIMTAANSMMLNGLYLVTALIVPWGDAGLMLRLGTAPVWLAVVGVPIVLAWLFLYVAVVREVSLASGMTPLRSLVISVVGISLYPVLIVLYQILLVDDAQVPLAVFVLYAVAVAFCMMLAVPIARRFQRHTVSLRPGRPRRPATIPLIVAGIVLVTAEMITGPIRIERAVSRPMDRPMVRPDTLTAPAADSL